MAMNSFELCFAIILASSLCLANGQKAEKGELEILYNNQPIEKYEEKLPLTIEFICQIKGWNKNIYKKAEVKCYLGDKLFHTANDKQSSLVFNNDGDVITTKFNPEIKEEDYGKKLECRGTYKDSNELPLEDDVELLMKSKSCSCNKIIANTHS